MEKLYMIENEAGETLCSEECKGMGTRHVFLTELADLFTLEEAAKLSTIYGGMVVPAPA